MNLSSAHRAYTLSGEMRPTKLKSGWRLAASLVAIVALVAVVACSDGKDSGSSVGSVDLHVTPGKSATTVQNLQGNASVRHPPDVTPTFIWSWERDGVDAGITTGAVPSSDTLKDQTWEVTVFADLGSSTSDPVSAEIRIVNSPPTITPATPTIEFGAGVCSAGNVGLVCSDILECAILFPGFIPGVCSPQAGTTLSAPVVSGDDDNDIVNVAYQWLVNDVVVATTPTLDPPFFTVGDSVKVNVTANDGVVDGPTGISNPVVIQPVPPPPP